MRTNDIIYSAEWALSTMKTNYTVEHLNKISRRQINDDSLLS